MHQPANRRTMDCYNKFIIGVETRQLLGALLSIRFSQNEGVIASVNWGVEEEVGELSDSDIEMVVSAVMNRLKTINAGITNGIHVSSSLNFKLYDHYQSQY